MIIDALKLLDKIRIVLIRTTEPGNIGSAARAMKTMGLSQLVLVNPKVFPSAKATARASGADDLLINASVVHFIVTSTGGLSFGHGDECPFSGFALAIVESKGSCRKSTAACLAIWKYCGCLRF